MLHLFNSDKVKVAGIKKYSNYSIVHELKTGDKTLSFNFPFSYRYKKSIVEEAYIRNKEQEFVIKEVRPITEGYEVTAVLNLETLEGVPHERFESKEQTITNALNLALVGTGWRVGRCNVTRKRTVRMSNSSSLEIVEAIRKAYRVEIVFNTLTRTIDVYEKLGSDKGTYFIDSLNLIELDIESNSYDFATRMIPVGEDGLRISSVNGGKDYIENFQYSNKVKTIYWKDERYTIPQNLKEDAIAKLEEISKPYKAYSALISNLAKKNSKYKEILSFGLGDVITLVSKKHQIREKQRIIKITEYPEEPSRDTIEIANAVLRFEDLQQELEEAANIINNVTTDNGTIDGDSIDEIESDKIKNFSTEVAKIINLDVVNAEINNLKVNKADIQSLNAVEAKIGTLEATTAKITDLAVINASIENLNANKAEITDLNATNAKINVLEVETAKIGILEGNVANIKDIINGNLSSDNIQAGGITGDRLNMKTIFVEDANIININASKINAGEISTNKVKIKSDDGGVEIVGATQQFKDRTNRVRIQMGKDTQGNFNFILRGEDGTTTLIDHTGIKEKAIADNLIKDSMIAPDSVGEKAIDYNSFSTGFNKETNTNTLKATKIKLDNQNQTLEVGFNALKTQTEGNTSIVNTHSTQINVSQGKIDTLIQDTSIVKDGQTVKLKDEYNKTVQTVDSMKNTITAHTTTINDNTGKISGVEIKTNELERNLNSFSSRLTSTEVNVESNKIVSGEALDKINGLKIGGRNLVLDSKPNTTNSNYQITTHKLSQIEEYINGEEYTCTIKGVVGGDKKGFKVFNSGGDIVLCLVPKSRFKDGIAVVTFRWRNEAGSYLVNNTHINVFAYEGENVGTSTIEWIKIEKGNKSSSDWSAAIEDTQAEITKTNNKVSGIEQSISNINLKVNEVETITTTNTSTINENTNAINVVDKKVITNTSAIDLLKNQISLKVEQTQVDKTIADLDIGTQNLLRRSGWGYINRDDWISKNINCFEVRKPGNFNYDELAFKAFEGIDDMYCINKNIVEVEGDSEYTISFDYRCTYNITSAETLIFERYNSIEPNSWDNVITKNIPKFIYSNDNVPYKRFSTTFKTQPRTKNINIRFDNNGTVNGAESVLVITNIKIEKGNKATNYGPSSKDLEEFATTKILEAKAEIKVTTDNINLEVSKKVNSSSIVSTINQTAEEVKIKASKIELNGATTIGDSNSNHVQIENAIYTIRANGVSKVELGVTDYGTVKNIPQLRMGVYGLGRGDHEFGIVCYGGAAQNPGGSGKAYTDISYYDKSHNDYSNIKLEDGGDIIVASVSDLVIKTNKLNGAYAGSYEREMARFGSSNAEEFDYNLKIGAVRNVDNSRGLVLADDRNSTYDYRVRVYADAGYGNFMPLVNKGNMDLGRATFKWRNIYATGGIKYSPTIEPGVNLSKARNVGIEDVIDSLEFIVPNNIYKNNEFLGLGINTQNLEKHQLSNLFIQNTREEFEGKIREDKSIDMASLLHLALYEIQNLKKEIKLLKSSNFIAA